MIIQFAKSKSLEFDHVSLSLDRRWFNEDDAKSLSTFDILRVTKPEFSCVSYGADHRYLQEDITLDFLKGLKLFDENSSVYKNLKANKFMKIYDCGKIVMRLKA